MAGYTQLSILSFAREAQSAIHIEQHYLASSHVNAFFDYWQSDHQFCQRGVWETRPK
jgi:hypothetical protein|tara:strand:- start:1647 stop:1817 length:171 start_codon:yes stop_codon:yes gene_type:complete